MECLVGPLKRGHMEIEVAFRTFFTSPDIRVLPIARGGGLRSSSEEFGKHGFKPLNIRCRASGSRTWMQQLGFLPTMDD